MVQTILTSTSPDIHHQVISNPEFLAEGTATPDLLNPGSCFDRWSKIPPCSDRKCGAKRSLVFTPTGHLLIELLPSNSSVFRTFTNLQLARFFSSKNFQYKCNLSPSQRGNRKCKCGRGCESNWYTDSRIGSEIPRKLCRIWRVLLPKGYFKPLLPVPVFQTSRGCRITGSRSFA